MALTVVRQILRRPGTTTPWVGAPVSVRLIGPGFVGGGTQLLGSFQTHSDSTTGLVSFTLDDTETMTPAGCYYIWHNPDRSVYKFHVPASGGPYYLSAVMDEQLNPPVVSDRIVTSVDGRSGDVVLAGDYVPQQDSAPNPSICEGWLDTSALPPTLKGWNGSAWVPIGGSGGGGGTTGVSSFQGRTGAVTLTKSDVTGTGLGPGDIGADPAGAASAAQTAAQNAAILTDATSASATPVAVTGQVLNCTAAGATITTPTPPTTVATPPARWAVRNASSGSQTLTYQSDVTGSNVTITLLTGEVVTFRHKSRNGWGADSGNKPLAALDGRFVANLINTDITAFSATLAAGVISNVAAGGVYFAPDPASTRGAPPLRFGVRASLDGGSTVTYSNAQGVTVTVSLLPGEARIFEQASDLGYGLASGIPLAQLDSRYANTLIYNLGAYTARPSGPGPYIYIGPASVAPPDALEGDLWFYEIGI